MTLTPRNAVALSVVLTGLLSACSPNPAVLQDRVYGSRAIPAPPPAKTVMTPAPARVPPKVVSVPAPSKKVIVTVPAPAPTPPPPVVQTPVEPVVVTTPPAVAKVVTPKVYQSSSAVQALVRQADTEVAKGNLDKAADTLERALRMEADNPDLWMKLAKINEQQGKHDQAMSMVNKAQAYREQLN